MLKGKSWDQTNRNNKNRIEELEKAISKKKLNNRTKYLSTKGIKRDLKYLTLE